MSNSSKDIDYVLRTVEERDVRFVRLWFTDVLGNLKSFAISPEDLEEAFEEGIGFDGSSVNGFSSVVESDMLAFPDAATFQFLPWRPSANAVTRIFCDICTPDRQPFEGDPRHCLMRVFRLASDRGFVPNVGPELEYFYSDSSKAPVPLDDAGYFDLAPTNSSRNLRRDTVLSLERLSIPVEYSFHAMGPSQQGISLRYAEAVSAADNIMTFKLAVKTLAQRNGLHATFMPKPIFGIAGSGMHTNMSLFREGKNVFFDERGENGLSKECYSFIAGILAHMKGMAAITNPLVNSYKRLVPGFEAPCYMAWSASNRSALIRIPASRGQGTRVELRSPDPSCNPYLAFAALLMAGLDGIQNKIHPGDAADKNLYDLPPEEAKEIPQVCGSLKEALEELDKGRAFLTKGGVFTDEFIDAYIELKSEEEIKVRTFVHPLEYDLYYSV